MHRKKIYNEDPLEVAKAFEGDWLNALTLGRFRWR